MIAPDSWSYVSMKSHGNFYGAAIVRGSDPESVTKELERLGLLPECRGHCEMVGGEMSPSKVPAARWRNRLLSKAELEECFGAENLVTEEEFRKRHPNVIEEHPDVPVGNRTPPR